MFLWPAVLALFATLTAGCANPVSSTWADFETNREIESAAADDSFPSAAEAGLATAGDKK